MPNPFTEAEKRINGSFGFIEVDGVRWLDVSAFEAEVSVEYADVQRGMDKDKKMVGRAGTGKFIIKKAYSRAGIIEKINAGKTPTMSLVAWTEDPDVGKPERIAINKIKIDKFQPMNFKHGELTEQEYTFNFAPSDLVYLDTIEA